MIVSMLVTRHNLHFLQSYGTGGKNKVSQPHQKVQLEPEEGGLGQEEEHYSRQAKLS